MISNLQSAGRFRPAKLTDVSKIYVDNIKL